MNQTRVMIVDDHPMVVEGVGMLLDTQDDLQFVGEVSDPAEVVAGIEKMHPDVLLLDISLPGVLGLDLIEPILMAAPEIGIVMHTMHNDRNYVQMAFQLGALGYVLKGVNSSHLLNAIRAAKSGEFYLCQEIRGRVPRGFLQDLLPAANPDGTLLKENKSKLAN